MLKDGTITLYCQKHNSHYSIARLSDAHNTSSSAEHSHSPRHVWVLPDGCWIGSSPVDEDLCSVHVTSLTTETWFFRDHTPLDYDVMTQETHFSSAAVKGGSVITSLMHASSESMKQHKPYVNKLSIFKCFCYPKVSIGKRAFEHYSMSTILHRLHNVFLYKGSVYSQMSLCHYIIKLKYVHEYHNQSKPVSKLTSVSFPSFPVGATTMLSPCTQSTASCIGTHHTNFLKGSVSLCKHSHMCACMYEYEHTLYTYA